MPNASIQVPIAIQTVNIPERYRVRFWSKVKVGPAGDCWPWLGWTDEGGYGGFAIYGKNYRAHRVAFVVVGGVIPPGLEVLHSCDNPPCCNPAHLWVGTQQQNIADMIRKGRNAKGDNTIYRLYPELRPDGEKNGRAILTAERVAQIRSGVDSVKTLAARFGVTKTTIYNVLRFVTWR